MKKACWIIVISAFIISCNTKKSDDEVVGSDSLINVNKPDSAVVIQDSHYFWSSELDQKNGLVMKKEVPVNADSLNAAYMINRLNEIYPEIRLEFIKASNDSIFLKVAKSNYLTKQMGSSGAEAYLAAVTYNMSELKGITYVDIRFKEGDHASPGTYTRTDFVHEK